MARTANLIQRRGRWYFNKAYPKELWPVVGASPFRMALNTDALEQAQRMAEALSYVREGDTLVVTRLDRLARSMIDLRQIVDSLAAKGVTFRCLQQGAIDTTRSDGKLLLNILASFAEFELDIRKERQKDGIEKAKASGVYKGRPPKLDGDRIAALHRDGVGPRTSRGNWGSAGPPCTAR